MHRLVWSSRGAVRWHCTCGWYGADHRPETEPVPALSAEWRTHLAEAADRTLPDTSADGE